MVYFYLELYFVNFWHLVHVLLRIASGHLVWKSFLRSLFYIGLLILSFEDVEILASTVYLVKVFDHFVDLSVFGCFLRVCNKLSWSLSCLKWCYRSSNGVGDGNCRFGGLRRILLSLSFLVSLLGLRKY